MITRTSQPANGALLISEMKEFASFAKATQRYIRRSLDVAYGRRDPIECWARDEGEAASIRAQARIYKQLDHLRMRSRTSSATRWSGVVSGASPSSRCRMPAATSISTPRKIACC